MISILMPIYNGIEFIQESVHSIRSQSFGEWELLIGINGHPSFSLTYQIAKTFEHERIRVYDFPHITNKSDALNQLVRLSTYDWIALLDVDDVWLPDKLASQVPYMQSYDVIGTRAKYFGLKTTEPKIPTGDITNYTFTKTNPIINSSCLVRKELCHWDAAYPAIEDYHLWLTLWKQGKRFYNVPSIQILHRLHDTSAYNSKDHSREVESLRKQFA